MSDHPKNVRDTRDAFVQAIADARAAGYRVDASAGIGDINASETARVGAAAQPAPGDEYDSMSKAAVVELAAARGLDASGTKADIVARLKNPPAV